MQSTFDDSIIFLPDLDKKEMSYGAEIAEMKQDVVLWDSVKGLYGLHYNGNDDEEVCYDDEDGFEDNVEPDEVFEFQQSATAGPTFQDHSSLAVPSFSNTKAAASSGTSAFKNITIPVYNSLPPSVARSASIRHIDDENYDDGVEEMMDV